jgi:hypothetical protein
MSLSNYVIMMSWKAFLDVLWIDKAGLHWDPDEGSEPVPRHHSGENNIRIFYIFLFHLITDFHILDFIRFITYSYVDNVLMCACRKG